MYEETLNVYLSIALEKFNYTMSEIMEELTKPSVLYKPKIYHDGNMWCCIYGEMPMCVVGFGKTPKDAVNAFNASFNVETLKLKEQQ